MLYVFLFQVILTKIAEGRTSFSYEELVNQMISDSRYMVSKYHLNHGQRDNLETIVMHIHVSAKEHFRIVGYGDNTGSCFPSIVSACAKEGWEAPKLFEDTILNQDTLT